MRFICFVLFCFVLFCLHSLRNACAMLMHCFSMTSNVFKNLLILYKLLTEKNLYFMATMGLKRFLDSVGFGYDLVTLAEGKAILVSKDGSLRTVVHRSAHYLMSRVEKM